MEGLDIPWNVVEFREKIVEGNAISWKSWKLIEPFMACRETFIQWNAMKDACNFTAYHDI